MRVTSFCYCFYPPLTVGNVAPAYKDINMIYITTPYFLFFSASHTLCFIPPVLIITFQRTFIMAELLKFHLRSQIHRLSYYLRWSMPPDFNWTKPTGNAQHNRVKPELGELCGDGCLCLKRKIPRNRCAK